MANKRRLKKAVHAICDELFAEAVALSTYGTETQQANADTQLYAIVKVEDECISRISHPEPGMKPSLYFKDLKEKFSAQLSDIIDQMNG
ncbi:MAG: hypothetical protein IJQ04_01190 [Prevotella sp.]|nr:hypothetical protein [Prevotella sp.]